MTFGVWGHCFTGAALAWAVAGLWTQAVLSLLVALGFALTERHEHGRTR